MIRYVFDQNVSTPLCCIMGKYGSDKGREDIRKSWHNYTTFYYSIFSEFREKKIRLFELGIGCKKTNSPVGASLLGWEEFFPNGRIYGCDIEPEALIKTERISTYYCDQTDKDVIRKMWEIDELSEQFDVIIDDGLHDFSANVCFFENSIHKLKEGGYYIIEDIIVPQYLDFLAKIDEWNKKYKRNFQLFYIPSEVNNYDNILLVCH